MSLSRIVKKRLSITLWAKRQLPWALIGWRMPTRSHPGVSDHDSDDMIQLQRHHCGSSAGRAPDNARAILAPLKVSGPPLPPRIKQTNAAPMERITGRDAYAFETVAQAAGQPQVLFCISPSPRLGNNVVDFQQPQHVALGTLAIPTPIARSCPYPTPHRRGDRLGTHGSSGARNPRRTASRSAWAFRNKPSW